MHFLQHHFGLDEANGLLPVVREVFEHVRPRHSRLSEAVRELQGRRQGAAPDAPADFEVGRLSREVRSLAAEIEDRLNELLELGIEVKSVEGLVDFRSVHEGRVVYLCWQWDEPEIRWFHELEAGYSGRREIEARMDFMGDDRQ